jgi:hypothetical protein
MLFLQFLNNVSIIKTKVLLPRAQVTVANSRACGSYQDFLDRGLPLTRKLLNLVKNIRNHQVTLNVKTLETQITYMSLGATKPRGLSTRAKNSLKITKG